MKVVQSALLLSMLLFLSPAVAQVNLYHSATVSEINEMKGGDLYLSVENNHFFINNEYSKPITWGYTLPGQYAAPLLKYLTQDQSIQIEAGAYLKHYFGRRDPISILPIFTVQANLTPSIQLIIGTLKGNLNHQTSDLLLQNEYKYTHSPEYGVQLKHDSKKLWMDLWINWERFIVYGDTIPEQFTAGVSINVPLLTTLSGWKILSPIQTIIVHAGGEISSFMENGYTDINNLLGIELEKSGSSWLDNWGAFAHYLHYKEFKTIKLNAFPKGEGYHVGAFAQKQNHNFNIAWWKGFQYQSRRGNPLYQSAPVHDERSLFPTRYLLTAKYAYKKELSNNVTFSILCEGYYNLQYNNFDYSYGVQLLYIPQFFLKNIQ